MISDKRIAEAAMLLGFGNDTAEIAALARTYQERRGDYPAFQREEAARHLLWTKNDPRGYEPGGFTSALLLAWGKADHVNQGRLAIGFPVYADAMGVLNSQGADALLQWAGVTA